MWILWQDNLWLEITESMHVLSYSSASDYYVVHVTPETLKCRFKDSRETHYRCSKCHIPEECIFYLPSLFWRSMVQILATTTNCFHKCVCDVSEPFQTSLKHKMATSLWLIDNHVQLMQSYYSESHGWCQCWLKASYILAFVAFLSSTFLVYAYQPKALNISEV
jgi:hypothetical protein